MMFCDPLKKPGLCKNPLAMLLSRRYHQSGCQKDAPLPLNERCRNVFYLQNYVSTTNTIICEGYKYRNCNHNSTGNQPSKHVWRNHPRIPCCRTTALNPHPGCFLACLSTARSTATATTLPRRRRPVLVSWGFEGPNPQCQPSWRKLRPYHGITKGFYCAFTSLTSGRKVWRGKGWGGPSEEWH